MNKQSRKILIWTVKIIAVCISVFYILYKVDSRASLPDDGERLLHSFSDPATRNLLYACLGLMIVNWTLETFKWQRLISTIEKNNFLKAARSVLTGITVSFFTPNRVGEFAGRIIHLDEGHRVKGAFAAFIGSSAQLLVTIQAGLIALAFESDNLFHPDSSVKIIITVFSLSSVVALIIAWYRLPMLAQFFENNKWLRKYNRFTEVFNHFNDRDLTYVYILSLVRYLVFCTQQYFLFRIFNVDIGYITCLKLSAVSFLLITLIPSVAFGELGIRGSINLWVFNRVTTDASAILITTFSLWCINLAFPALIGALSLLYVRLWKEQ